MSQPPGPGDPAGGGTVPGSQPAGPGDIAEPGTVLGVQLALLGIVVGAQTTLR